MTQYFPKPFNSYFVDSIKVKIDLSNYATKTDIKNISHVDKLDIDKLVAIPIDLSKLSDVVKNDIVKKNCIK